MADGKKSFLLYRDQIHVVEMLDDVTAGKLVKMIYKYIDDQDPTTDDLILKLAFEPIKQQLKRDLKDWEGEKMLRSESGRLGGIKSGVSRRKKALKANKANASNASSNEALASSNEANEANEAVNVTVNDTVTVNKTLKDSESTILEPTPDLKNSNLFKKPNIPTKQQVLEAITNAGGNKEMAKSFYEKHESTGWFINGSPVVNYVVLAQRFVTNWKSVEGKNKKTEKEQPSAAPLTKIKPS